MRTRIRCPLCGALAWESNFEKGTHNIDILVMDCKKSKGKGHGRNTFKFYQMVDKSFKQRVLEFLYRKVESLEQYLRIQIGGIDWQKSENVWIQTAQPTYFLTITESYTNPKINATPSAFLQISPTNSKQKRDLSKKRFM
jgi:hypothetical protein